jgi:hypothetical protein
MISRKRFFLFFSFSTASSLSALWNLGPRALGEFALHFEFAELRGGRPQGLVGVGNRAETQAVVLWQ